MLLGCTFTDRRDCTYFEVLFGQVVVDIFNKDFGANLLTVLGQRAPLVISNVIYLHIICWVVSVLSSSSLSCSVSYRTESARSLSNSLARVVDNTIVFKSIVDPLAVAKSSATYVPHLGRRERDRSYVSMFLGASSRYDCCAESREVSF